MRLSIRFRDLDAPPEVHARVERAVREALELHASRLGSARVTLRPSPPMHGAGRSSCRIRVRLRNGRGFTSEEHAHAPDEAAAAAAWRIGQRLDRARSLEPGPRRGADSLRHIA